MKLYFAPGCPFAHRTRSLLTHLSHPFEAHEIDLAHKPADFLAISPTGRVPLLEDDGFVLYESAVINEYLVDSLAATQLLAPTARARARQRLAMTQFDAIVAPMFFRLLKNPALPEADLAAVKREVAELALTAQSATPASLFGFHLAPFWLRFNWVEPSSRLIAEVRQLPALAAFLDAAVQVPAVAANNPDQAHTVKETRAKFT